MPTSLRAAYIEAVQRDVDAAYFVSTAGRAESSPQGIASVFDRAGVSIQGMYGDRWSADVRLTSLGYGQGVHPVDIASEVRFDKNRVEYQRPGVTEWYVNGPLGLEQGFTLTERPAADDGPGSLKDLEVGVDVRSDLRAVESQPGVVDLVDGRGRIAVRVRDVFAKDATGKEFAARMSVENGAIRIHVDDRGATYPLVIDPTYAQQAEMTASDAATSAYFGFSAALDGTTAMIGAKGANGCGAVYVFTQSGAVWTQQAKIGDPGCVSGDQFGSAVSLSSGTAVIGARGANSGAGAAYVFTGSGATWTQQQQLTQPDNTGADYYGAAVAVSTDTAVVGASLNNAKTGSAYIWTRSGGVWTMAQEYKGSAAGDMYGSSVAVDSSTSTAVVGAMGANNTIGRAFAYLSSGGNWSLQGTLNTTEIQAGTYMGNAAAISGNTVVVGASRVNNLTGAAYVFTRSGSTWSSASKLVASDAATGNYFGWAVAVASNGAVMASAISRNGDTGAVYQFANPNGSWVQQAIYTASDAATGRDFGTSLAMSGSNMIVGSSAANSATGAAYAFATAAPTVTTSCSTNPCTSTSTITVNWTGLPGYSNDYIAIAVPGSASTSYITYKYTGGGANGSMTFTNIGAGTYVARSFANNSTTIAAESSQFSVQAGTPTLSASCSANPCLTSSTITVTYSGMPGYSGDYIALAPSGSAATNQLQYVYTNGKINGSVTFTNLPAGQSVVARAFQNNTFTQVGSDTAPAISIQGSASITVLCGTDCTGQAVQVSFTGFPGYSTDYIAIIPAGGTDSQWQTYKYTGGATSGTLNLGTLPNGTWYAQGYQNNTTTHVGNPSANFVVTTALPTPTLTPTVSGSTVTVAYTNMAGYRYDWIDIAPAGSAATTITQWKYTGGAINGSLTFNNVASGSYATRAFFNNSNNIAGQTLFSVP